MIEQQNQTDRWFESSQPAPVAPASRLPVMDQSMIARQPRTELPYRMIVAALMFGIVLAASTLLAAPALALLAC